MRYVMRVIVVYPMADHELRLEKGMIRRAYYGGGRGRMILTIDDEFCCSQSSFSKVFLDGIVYDEIAQYSRTQTANPFLRIDVFGSF
jgi:hypothetical protein